MLSLEKLIERSGKLSSLPDIMNKVFKVMDDPNSTATKIGKVINDDPALTARLLKLVNSPFYGFTGKVDTVYRAVALIGHTELRSVVVAASAINVFDGIPSELVSMRDFWTRSLATAVTARVIAAFKREKEMERFFIAGLLHDIGSLLLYLKMPEEMLQVLQMEKTQGLALAKIERHIMGFDHIDVGGGLLKKWNLPPQICASVRYQLEPLKAPEKDQSGAWTLCLAQRLVARYFQLEATPNGGDVQTKQADDHAEDSFVGDSVDDLHDVDDVSGDDLGDAIWEANKLDPALMEKIIEKSLQQFDSTKGLLLS